jgi:hypothetical protein
MYSYENEYCCVLPAELWDPNAGDVIPGTNLRTGKWIVLASAPMYRGYHSTAILLPDGRIMTGGGNVGDPFIEFFSPPYLFNKNNTLAKRPVFEVIGPEKRTYDQPLQIKTTNPQSISAITLIRLSSVTHSFNSGQRINRLAFKTTATGVRATLPANSNLCPPGYYMLFLISNRGVPSQARIIKMP